MYDDDSYEYDVALIKLPTPIKMDAKAKPIKLASSNSAVQPGSAAVVTGWGFTSVSGSISSNLQTLTAPVVDQNTCRKIFAAQHKDVTQAMLCAGSLQGSQGSCQGDSGGPLVLNGVQIGIVSWGANECARQGYPGVYTRVSEVRSWIDAKQKEKCISSCAYLGRRLIFPRWL
ncbi:trypsin-7-like [Lasioglossum baleicum]|uniref:trypsin-7-like n=1 Tax=Lasioglossum baleicum TaxID=434251 RepID=UPI003FCE7C3A